MSSCFSSTDANDLEDYFMIAGDTLTLTYNVYDDNGDPLDISSATCSVVIFPYQDPGVTILDLSGTISSTETGVFTVELETDDTINLSGVYQHQPRIEDVTGATHIPSQGKLTIFPSPAI